MSNVSRRQMLGLMGGAMAVGFGAGCMGNGDPAMAAAMPVEETPFSWTPHILKPKAIQEVAREGYYYKGFGCGYGVFWSIIGTMGKEYGAPYNSFPYSMLEMGKGGISDWGTICGALLGGVAAMALFWGRKERDPMVSELFRWYETTKLPIYQPPKGLAYGMDLKLPQNVSGSVLCHISVGKWCYETGIAAGSKERSERCSRITADVAKKTVEIMNSKIQGKFKGEIAFSDDYKNCTQAGCHGGNAEKFEGPWLKGQMDCTPCHSGSEHVMDKTTNHP
ncbi:C-GCAxxG-C-C family protein [Desulfovibrio sp. OttesenSCG-928-C14]|nr:C-GCAxxG-C-C family protein [Desulfovibrio sp. OttesenSCG-928-C14]